MDNLFFQFFLRYWPMLVAIVITVLLVYQWTRPKVQPEKLQKGLIKQHILLTLEDESSDELDDIHRQWLESKETVTKYLNSAPRTPQAAPQYINYQSQITLSLVWTLIWIGVETFLIIRIIVCPYYYANEAIFLGCFTYYIIIGLISYFRR